VSNKDKYSLLCKEEKQMPIFLQDWWLECVSCGRWDAFLVQREGKTLAALPYYVKKKYGFLLCIPPVMTPRNGIFIRHTSNLNLSASYEEENSIMEELAEQINALHPAYFSCNFFPFITSHLGFFWQGFSATVRYTYKVDVSDIEQTFLSFEKKRRQYIRGAERIVAKIDTQYKDLQALYLLFSAIFSSQRIKTPLSFSEFKDIITQSQAREAGKLFVALDKEENVMAFLFVVWDTQTCYNLISARNKEEKNSHAESLLIYQAMKNANAMGLKDYDLEGSMIKGVEKYFRSFGAVRTPYMSIEKVFNPLYRFFRAIKHH
jgi:lipid II:glycine glycyltransferase (peptidoglycan interpeptide bridge formation enzyme)